MDTTRVTRIRDGPLSATSTVSDTPISGSGYGRGLGRGRGGRGDWDRGRGRGTHQDDRDSRDGSYRPRSRSRDRGWGDRDRDFRDERSRDHDRDTRRDDDKRSEWDGDRDRYNRRDAPPARPESRNSGGSHTNPSTPLSAHPANQANVERFRENQKHGVPDTSRRASIASNYSDQKGRDEFRNYVSSRAETTRSSAQQGPSSPVQAPQVPAFGSIAARPHVPQTSVHQISPKEDHPPHPPVAPKADIIDPIKVAPKAPKAELSQVQPPTGPKAGVYMRRGPIAPLASPARPMDGHDAPGSQSPSMPRYSLQRPASSSNPPTGPSQSRGFSGHWGNQIGSALNQSPDQGRMDGGPSPPIAPAGGPFAGSRASIPTGPKASQPSIRAPMAPRGLGLGIKNTWVNPKLNRPSIMNTVPPTIPVKREYPNDDRGIRLRSGSLEQTSPRMQHKHAPGDQSTDHGHAVDDAMKLDVAAPTSTRSVSEAPAFPTDEDTGGQTESVSDDEENLDLEDDKAERTYQRELENLEARRPASPRHHPELMLLLEEVDALALAQDDLANGVAIPPEPVPKTEAGLPSPKSEPGDEKKEDIKELIKYDQVSLSEDLPLDGLPFLASGPPTPVSEMSICYEESTRGDRMKDEILRLFHLDREDKEAEQETLRTAYETYWLPWRREVEQMDQEKRDEEQKRATTPLPPGSVEPAGTPTPAAEGGRRNRAFNTQLELEQALAASILTADAELGRTKDTIDADYAPDMQKEATIPDMLTEKDRDATQYRDTNQIVDSRLVLEAFAFIPPEDDFTAEEQQLFVDGYTTTPKKWGHIAQWIEGRDYQDCIRHYYLTKRQHQYKTLVGKKVSRRGRRAGPRGAVGRPKANALITDLRNGPGGELYEAQVAVTDKGRPKRAAAPIFNEKDKKDGEGSKLGRRGGGTKTPAEGTDGTPEKVPGRRGRQPNRERGSGRGRGGKTHVLAPHPSPMKKESERERDPSKEPKVEDLMRARELESAGALTALHATQPAPPVAIPPTSHTNDWRVEPRPPTAIPPAELRAAQIKQPLQQIPMSDIQAPRQEPPMPGRHGQGQSQARGAGSQTSSYWSVPEQNDFKALLGHFGSDWNAIAGAMKSKTHIMVSFTVILLDITILTNIKVKNYFHRAIEKGDKDSLEALATQADEHIKAHGPPIGPPPLPTTQRTRPRDNSTAAQTVPQRILAPNPEVMEVVDDGRPTSANQASPPQYPGQTRLVPLRQAGPTAVAVQVTQQDSPPPNARVQPQPQQTRPPQPIQVQAGPRVGYFTSSDRISHAPPPSQPQLMPAAPPRGPVPTDREREHQPPSMTEQHQRYEEEQLARIKQEDAALSRQQQLEREQKMEQQRELELEHQRRIRDEQIRIDREREREKIEREFQQREREQRMEQEKQQHQISQQMARQQEQLATQEREARMQQDRLQQDRELQAKQSQYAPQHSRHPSHPSHLSPAPNPLSVIPQTAHHLSQVRPPSMLPREQEHRERIVSYQHAQSVQSNPLTAPLAEPSPAMRRHDSYGQRYGQSTHSPVNARASVASPGYPPHELLRPSSVPNSGYSQPPAPPTSAPARPAPAPTPAPAKRSNLMSLLNDDPPETKPPPRKTSADTQPASLAPSQQAPPRRPSPGSIYQSQSQPPPYQSREPPRDSIHEQSSHMQPQLMPQHYQSHYSRQPSYRDQQSALQPVPPPSSQPSKDPWAQHQSIYERQPSRPSYAPPSASPTSQPAYLQGRTASYTSQPSHEPPQQPPQSHTRATSYTTLPHGQPHATGQTLTPSPYAAIRPPAHHQPLQPHPPTPQQPPHLAPLHQAGSVSVVPGGGPPVPGQSRRQDTYSLTALQGDPMRRDREYPTSRQDGPPGLVREHSGGVGLGSRDPLREASLRDTLREEQQRRYAHTPPHGQGYGAYQPPQGGGQDRRYEQR